MPKGPCTFRKSDVRRMIEATESAGIRVGRVELQAGKVIVIPQSEDQREADKQEVGGWDNL